MTDKFLDFFRKRRSDQKFKKAGPGHKLTEPKQERKTTLLATKPKTSQPTDGARRAAEAALARVEAHKQQNKIPNWSLEAIRIQAKKEMELESQLEQKTSSGPKLVSQDSAPVLSVSGVFFHCALVGPEVLPKHEMQMKIKELLYQQMEHEPELTACLILKTCNHNKEKVNQGVDTICKYFNNIIQNPDDEKYQKIRMQNKVFQEKVSILEGALDVLCAAGFHQTSDGEFMVFDQEKVDTEHLEMLVEALQTSEPILPELDRNTRVLLPLEAHAQIRLPDEFFNLSADEIRREQEKRTEEVELNAVLRTKAMRQRDAQKELRLYRYTLIRIKFPDGIILQGTFLAREKLSNVLDFILENLAEPSRKFQLCVPGGSKLDSDCTESTLLDLKLVPAAVLHLSWSSNHGEFSKSTDEAFLKPETMALLQSL